MSVKYIILTYNPVYAAFKHKMLNETVFPVCRNTNLSGLSTANNTGTILWPLEIYLSSDYSTTDVNLNWMFQKSGNRAALYKFTL